MTDAYLAPIQLRSTTLTLIYSTISLPSWSAGSHQVSCSVGATLGNGGLASQETQGEDQNDRRYLLFDSHRRDLCLDRFYQGPFHLDEAVPRQEW